MRKICFIVCYLLISLIRDSSGNLNTKNESFGLLTLLKNKDIFNINNTLLESTSNANSSLHVQSCGRVLTSPTGIFTSPNFPNNYDNNQRCEWLIRVQLGTKILLSFQEFSLESCPSDIVQVYDGANNMATLLGGFCGTTLPSDLASRSNQLFVTFKSDYSVTFKGFKADYKTTDQDCGGILTSPNGTFTSPNFPNNYENNKKCAWLIRVKPGTKILLTFQEFSLESGSYDIVKVYDGANNIATLLGSFSGTTLPSDLTSRSNKLFVTFTSDSSNRFQGFKANYRTVQKCGFVLTSPNGTFTSPNFPNDYDNNLVCGWLIQVQTGKRILLTFQEFHLELSSIGSCSRDAVEVYDGENDMASLLGSFCGNILPSELLSSKNQLFVRFTSDHSITYKGFKAEYETRCGGIFTEPSGILTSPNYPDDYPPNAQCIYEIRLEPEHFVNLTIQTMSIESYFDCSFDYLQIRDGDNENSSLKAQLCGSTVPEPIISTTNSLWMKFKTDDIFQYQGFYVTYNSIKNAFQKCGGVLTSPNGTFTSPNFPNDYDNNLVCEWLIRVPTDKKIFLTFQEFHLESSSFGSCSHDFVEVYDGENDVAPLLGSFCGNILPSELLSSKNQLFVRFKSDNTITYKGFKAEYQTISGCGGVFTDPSGTLTSPNYPDIYPPNAQCIYKIRLVPGNLVNIIFQVMEIEDHSRCLFDYLQIRDGDNENSPLKAQLCGRTLPEPIVSTTNYLWMKFRTDHSLQYQGFKITYNSIKSGCGGVYTNPTGILTSPNYPDNYPPNSQCIYEIRLDPGKLVNLTFYKMEIESHSECKFDYLQVRDGGREYSPLIAQLCGTTVPKPIISTTNLLWMNFKTDDHWQYRGFYATYHAIENRGCGGVLTFPNGTFTSPNFPNYYDNNLECEWLIRVNPNERLLLKFLEFHVESSSDCSSDAVEVYDGGNITSPLLGRFCGLTRPSDLFSQSNQLFVRFKSDSSVTFMGFKAEYKTTYQDCGGILTSPNGTFTSPNFPNDYENDVVCEWLIRVKPDKKIFLTFREFELEQGGFSCMYDFVEVYDGANVTARLLGRFCDRNKPNPLSSKSNQLLVRFKSDTTNRYKGFKAEYRTDCDCGRNGNCSFTYSGAKYCQCNKGYADWNGFCSFCDCGPHGKCSFNYRGVKKCDCDYGYVLRNEFCSDYTKDDKTTNDKGSTIGWEIATYVCAVLISIIIIGMLIIIATKSCTRRSENNQREGN